MALAHASARLSPPNLISRVIKRSRSPATVRVGAMPVASAAGASPPRLAREKAIFLVCDVQERFRPVIHGFEHCVHVSSQMMRAAKILDVPVLVTEQYPEKLGATVDELQPNFAGEGVVRPAAAKKKFAMTVPEVDAALAETPERTQAVIMGLEAHVCVLQTALDLIARGYEVFVLVDGTSSQRTTDRAVAFRRLESAGAILASSEMALFEMLGSADAPNFRDISALVREARPEPPLPAV